MRLQPTLIFAIVLAMLANPGCSHRSRTLKAAPGTDVGVSMIIPNGAERMQLPTNQAFQMAFPVHDPLPDYPAELISNGHDEISVCIEVVVTAEGALGSVAPLYAQAQCPLDGSEMPEAFVSATLAALKQ